MTALAQFLRLAGFPCSRKGGWSGLPAGSYPVAVVTDNSQ